VKKLGGAEDPNFFNQSTNGINDEGANSSKQRGVTINPEPP